MTEYNFRRRSTDSSHTMTASLPASDAALVRNFVTKDVAGFGWRAYMLLTHIVFGVAPDRTIELLSNFDGNNDLTAARLISLACDVCDDLKIVADQLAVSAESIDDLRDLYLCLDSTRVHLYGIIAAMENDK